ncbi:MAG: DUF1080 domain-containing protein [Anaerohalosphaera sp.]|nr:DUF1080 domain-containing protein [Anaerohalosphaera sp.]
MVKCIKHSVKGRLFTVICISLGVVFPLGAAKLLETSDGVVGYSDIAKLPWCSYRKHDPTRPVPVHVYVPPETKTSGRPSDAILLFDGKDLSQWEQSQWKVENGYVTAGSGNLVSKQFFGDCQLHVEFCIPQEYKGPLFNRGNSGVFLMGHYEVQIFDSHPDHKQQFYPDGQCAAIYGETPPLVNVCRKAGQWQSYDIVFTAPTFKEGKVSKPATITMLHNGVLVHLNSVVHGATGHMNVPGYKTHNAEMPLMIQGHSCPVRFRNIWIRPLSGLKKLKL